MRKTTSCRRRTYGVAEELAETLQSDSECDCVAEKQYSGRFCVYLWRLLGYKMTRHQEWASEDGGVLSRTIRQLAAISAESRPESLTNPLAEPTYT